MCQSNECLLLDVTITDCKREDVAGEDWAFGAIGGPDEPTVHLLEQLLPMAVERGRRTYSHKPDCRYLTSGSCGGWGKSVGSADQDEYSLMPLCRCGAGKVGGWLRGCAVGRAAVEGSGGGIWVRMEQRSATVGRFGRAMIVPVAFAVAVFFF